MLHAPQSNPGEQWDEGSARYWDAILLIASLIVVSTYHLWYYSWRWSMEEDPRGYHRVDLTGQRAREIFVRSVIFVERDTPAGIAESNLAIQAARNPITANSILATGTTVGATTLVGILLDAEKMEQVRQLGRSDPLTGTSTLFSPEAKLACAIGVLFLSFFSLAQSLRLFTHFGFFARAASYAHRRRETYSDGTVEMMFHDSCNCCLRAQTFMSLGFRGLYCFIPLVMWLMGGSYLLGSSVLVTLALFNLDKI